MYTSGQKVVKIQIAYTSGHKFVEIRIAYTSKLQVVKIEMVYTSGQTVVKNKIVSQIKLNIPTYKKEDLPKELMSLKAIKPGSRVL